MIKRVSLVRRKPEMSREEFLQHWMGPHAAIVRQLPGLRGLRFGVVEECSTPDEAWDGIGEVWFDSRAAAAHAFSTEPYRSQLIDDRQKFLGALQWYFVSEHTVIAPPK